MPTATRRLPSKTLTAGADRPSAAARRGNSTRSEPATGAPPSRGRSQYNRSIDGSDSTAATVSAVGVSRIESDPTPAASDGSVSVSRRRRARSADRTRSVTFASPVFGDVRRSACSYADGNAAAVHAGIGSASGSGTGSSSRVEDCGPSVGRSAVVSPVGSPARVRPAEPRTRTGARTCARWGSSSALAGPGRNTASVDHSGVYGATVAGSISMYSISRSLGERSSRLGG